MAELAAILGGVVATGGFALGFNQYVQAQRWKRLEFVLQQVNDLEDDWRVRAVLRMLDWYDTRVRLHFPGEDPDGTRVDEEMFVSALRPHGDDDRFSPPAQAVRECFDVLLDGLDRLNHYVDARYIQFMDIRPYLRYWLDLLADGAPNPRIAALKQYMDHYGFDGAVALVDKHRNHGGPPSQLPPLARPRPHQA